MNEQWDILKRCRVFADGFDENYIARGIAEDAHDEIVALRAEVADLLKVAAHERVHNGELRAEFERLTRAGNQYMEEIERLRGIVQADLEEKAEAWGEVERLKAAIRAMVLAATEQSGLREEYQEWDKFERLAAEALRDASPTGDSRPEFLDDGFGNVWQKCQPYEKCRMQIVRPGKMQCDCVNPTGDSLK